MPASALPGRGPVLLVMDNGWASAAGWPRRIQAADAMLDRAARAGRQVALLPTAPDDNGAAPADHAADARADLRARLAALQPEALAGGPGRRGRRAQRAGGNPAVAVVYLADGLTDGDAFRRSPQALADAGPVTEMCCDAIPPRLLLPPASEADQLVARVAQTPQPVPSASAACWRRPATAARWPRRSSTFRRVPTAGSAAIMLPPELRNRLTRLVLASAPSAGVGRVAR